MYSGHFVTHYYSFVKLESLPCICMEMHGARRIKATNIYRVSKKSKCREKKMLVNLYDLHVKAKNGGPTDLI